MKERLDIILVKRGHAASREKAKALILAGNVSVNGQTAKKAGEFLEEEGLALEVRGDALRYVGRGGLKLEKAVEKWGLDLNGRVCMDIGASTGGFTDCMLQNGAARVYAVDVGHGQLAQCLREDERVVCMEGTNIRYLAQEDIGEKVEFVGADVSFISLTKILVPAGNLLAAGGRMVCLVKPQFEAGKGKVGKNGVVKNPQVHREVLAGIVDYASGVGFGVRGLDYSPVRGQEGNREYLLYLEKGRAAGGEGVCTEETGRTVSQIVGQPALQTASQIAPQYAALSHTPQWRQRIAGVVEESHKV